MGKTGNTYKEGFDTYFLPFAGDFYDICTEWSVDPGFIFSMGVMESAFGTSTTFTNTNDCETPFNYNLMYYTDYFGDDYDVDPENKQKNEEDYQDDDGNYVFGYGNYIFDGANFIQIDGTNPNYIVIMDEDIYDEYRYTLCESINQVCYDISNNYLCEDGTQYEELLKNRGDKIQFDFGFEDGDTDIEKAEKILDNIDDPEKLLQVYTVNELFCSLHVVATTYAGNTMYGQEIYKVRQQIFGELYAYADIRNSSLDVLIEYIHSWEGTPEYNADKSKYVVFDDGAGNRTVGWGVLVSTRQTIFEDAGYETNYGAEIDIDFVDCLEEQAVMDAIKDVTSVVSGLNLPKYQIYALVSRAYNCGVGGAVSTVRNGKTFVEAYKAYWNSSTDDWFERQTTEANFNEELYTKYLKDPQTAYNEETGKNEYLLGLELRRKSEFTLFQTGYYDKLGKWYTEVSPIVEEAAEIMEYMQDNSYYYCLLGGSQYEYVHQNAGLDCGLTLSWENSKLSTKEGYHLTCCATYVSWVLIEAGYIGQSYGSHAAYSLRDNLVNQYGWTKITNYAEIEPGDVFISEVGEGHTDIYAGEGLWYNAGSNDHIRSSPCAINREDTFNAGTGYCLRAPTN